MPRYQGFYASGNEISFDEALGLCQASYTDLEPGSQIPARDGTWTVERKMATGGFAAYTIRKAGGWTAAVYRGTANWQGWMFNNLPNMLGMPNPPQYDSGLEFARQHPPNTILVGHSLGGGIATYASAHLGNPAVTIFPAPVIPRGLPNRGVSSDVVNYVCHGEALTEITQGGRRTNTVLGVVQDVADVAVSGSFHRRLGHDIWVQSNGVNPIDMHSLSKIAA